MRRTETSSEWYLANISRSMSVQDARNVGNFTIGFICYKLCTNRPFAGFSHISLFCAMLGRKLIEEYFVT